MDDWLATLRNFLRLFRPGPSLPPGLIVMPFLAAVVWPLAHIASGDARAAFMLTFVLVMALRFALGAERIIRKIAGHVAPRTAAIVILMCGPGLMAALIWAGEPLWCQRLLSAYFAAMALAYMSDVVSGQPRMLTFHFAQAWGTVPAGLLARMMVIYHLTLLLFNETLIAQATMGLWLVFFALMPQINQRMGLALVRSAYPQPA